MSAAAQDQQSQFFLRRTSVETSIQNIQMCIHLFLFFLRALRHTMIRKYDVKKRNDKSFQVSAGKISKTFRAAFDGLDECLDGNKAKWETVRVLMVSQQN